MTDASRKDIAAPPPPRSARRFLVASVTDFLNEAWWRVALVALVGAFLINALFWLIGLANAPDESLGETLRGFALGTSIGFAMWMALGYLNSWLTGKVDWQHRPWRTFAVALLSNVVVATTTLGAVYFMAFVVFGDETAAGWLARQRPNNYIGSVLVGLLISAIYQGAFFLRGYRASVIEREELKRANLQAKYEALNAQINPHFLFNSLNVLSALVRRDPGAAEGFIQGMSEVYRYVLAVRGERLVPLDRELDALDAFAKLVTMRFGDSRLRILVDLAPRPGEQVVPLALQMLVENAVKHNGATRKRPLHIRICRAGDGLEVTNNRVPLFDEPDGAGVGLDNIRERYKLALGREVEIVDGAEAFTVRLPL